MPASPLSPAPVSAYIPCYNNAATLKLTIEGIRQQTHPVTELFVVDDGSTDRSAQIADDLGVHVVRMGRNQGRGAVRARAMELARNEFVLCCDATNRLTPPFLEGAVKWFEYDHILAVFGRWFAAKPKNGVDRWRSRHLFQQEVSQRIDFGADLSTHGTLIRKSVVMKVGNYDPTLRHGEDYDLGSRFLDLGDIVYDPALRVETVVHNTLYQVLERYTRWNRASIKHYTMGDFRNSLAVATRIMMPRDWAARDVPSALISALMPFFAIYHADRRSLSFPPRAIFHKPVPFHERARQASF